MSFGSRFDSENYADNAALDVTHKWQAKLATIDEKITEISSIPWRILFLLDLG